MEVSEVYIDGVWVKVPRAKTLSKYTKQGISSQIRETIDGLWEGLSA